MLSWLDEVLIPLITSMYEAVGYLGVAIAMAVDASSFPVPSEFILPFAGFLVADPTAVEPLTGGRWLLIPTIAAATLGGLVGTLGAYAIGAYGGRPLLNRFGRIVRIDPADLDRADAFFARHGGKIVFWSRFIPLLRTAISFPAGIARMPLGRFLLYSAAGSLIVGVPALLLLGAWRLGLLARLRGARRDRRG
jgi:membrane protein DedA with SNARE-associated domain